MVEMISTIREGFLEEGDIRSKLELDELLVGGHEGLGQGEEVALGGGSQMSHPRHFQRLSCSLREAQARGSRRETASPAGVLLAPGSGLGVAECSWSPVGGTGSLSSPC